jgi:hypothetical protein
MKNNPRNKYNLALWSAVLTVVLLPTGMARAQAKSQSKPSGQNRLAPLLKFEGKFGPSFANKLSSGGASMFHLAKVL